MSHSGNVSRGLGWSGGAISREDRTRRRFGATIGARHCFTCFAGVQRSLCRDTDRKIIPVVCAESASGQRSRHGVVARSTRQSTWRWKGMCVPRSRFVRPDLEAPGLLRPMSCRCSPARASPQQQGRHADATCNKFRSPRQHVHLSHATLPCTSSLVWTRSARPLQNILPCWRIVEDGGLARLFEEVAAPTSKSIVIPRVFMILFVLLSLFSIG